ncbi:MAG: DUF488 domain-containing protein [Anaerolineae bacterium]
MSKVNNTVEIYAVGHSTRPLDKFIALLQAHQIQTLVDIRTVPRSRTNPQFNGDNLERELPRAGIRYVHLKALGGLRRPNKDSSNLGWENASFRGYADYMQTDAFRTGLDELIGIAQGGRAAIMCAEGNPFRCHRNLVADALTARGHTVLHISSPRTARPHQVTPFAHLDGERVTYPAGQA